MRRVDYLVFVMCVVGDRRSTVRARGDDQFRLVRKTRPVDMNTSGDDPRTRRWLATPQQPLNNRGFFHREDRMHSQMRSFLSNNLTRCCAVLNYKTI